MNPEQKEPRTPRGLPADPGESLNPTRPWLGRPANHALPLPPSSDDPTRALLDKSEKGPAPVPPSSEDPTRAVLNRPTPLSSGATRRLGREAGVLFTRMIGRGGFGEVHEAIQNSLERLVAVKIIRRDAAEKWNRNELHAARDLFRAEAITGGLLDHPNILPIYDLMEDSEGNPMLAMKLARGRTWRSTYLEDRGRLSREELLEKYLPVLVLVSQAVAFAHARGVVHRDLKMSQVMIGEYGEVLLMDWGLAVMYNREAVSSTTGFVSEIVNTLETATNPAGTPAYMAPEQTDDRATKVGPWTDVYLLGGILYELMVGQTPHPGPSAEETYVQATLGFVPHPDVVCPGMALDRELVAIAMRALEKDQTRRPRNASEFSEELQAYLSGASRRRESQAKSADALRRLEGAGADYTEFNVVLTLASEALRLWPRNTEAIEVRERALAQFARAALKKGDLGLARLQAERMEPSLGREEVLELVASGEAQAEAFRLARKRAIIATYVLLMLIVVGGTIFGYFLNEARERAEKARIAAVESREDAVGTLRFLMLRLFPRLEQFRDKQVSSEVLDAAGRFFVQNQPDPNEEDEVKRIRFYLLTFRAKSLADERQTEEALKLFRSALKLREGMPRSGESDQVSREFAVKQDFDTAHTLNSMVPILMQQGQKDEALEASQKAVELVTDLVSRVNNSDFVGETPVPNIYSVQTNALIRYAGLLRERGDTAKEEDALARAFGSALEAERRFPADTTIRNDLATVASSQADRLSAAGRMDEAITRYGEALAILDELFTANPGRAEFRRRGCIVRLKLGYVLLEAEHYEEAYAAGDKARLDLTEMATGPSGARFVPNLMVARNLALEALIDLRRFNEARALAGEARAQSEGSPANGPRTSEVIGTDAMRCLLEFRLLRESGGDVQPALEAVRRITEELEALAEADRTEANRNQLVLALTELGRRDEALAILTALRKDGGLLRTTERWAARAGLVIPPTPTPAQ